MSPSQLLICDTFVVLYFRCAYSCFSQRSNCSCGVFSRQRHSKRVLLIEILKILLISGRVEKQDLETVPGEVEGGISWPWVCLESLGCILPPAVRSPSPALFFPVLQGSSGTCSLSFLHGMGEATGGIYATEALVIMAWVSLSGKDPEQFLQLPSCLCSGHGKCEVEESQARF